MTDDFLRAGVIGWPVAHSKSPRLHGFWLKRHGVAGSYEAVAARPEDFEQTVRRLIAQGWRGANVTIPHKESALRMAEIVSDRAAAIGAANTLVFTPGGAIEADNTDGFGFIENLAQSAGDRWRSEGEALVLGAGGAARAIVWSLLERGAARVVIANRTRERADALAAEMGARAVVVDWSDFHDPLRSADLIVNTTSLGMEGRPPLEISFASAKSTAVATDIVYVPLMTPFLESARSAGLRVVDGLGMLLHQARPGFEAWFGPEPQVDDEVRRLMLAP